MKKFLVLIMAMMAFVIGVNAQSIAQAATEEANVYLQFLYDNYVYILPVLSWLIYRFVPTGKADIIIKAINWIISLIPDKKKGGGVH